MKIQSHRSPQGFTLVELLVVIAIIAVLASAGFAAGNAAIQKARKTTALATATAIESAVSNFYTEYGSMPSIGSSDTTVQTDSAEGLKLLEVLLGLEGTGGSVINTRGIKFLSVKEGKGKRNGLVYNTTGTTIQGLYDPWGGPYHVMLDLDYDEKLTVTPSAGGNFTLNGRRVAVWSNGADYKEGNKATDDVRTWGQ